MGESRGDKVRIWTDVPLLFYTMRGGVNDRYDGCEGLGYDYPVTSVKTATFGMTSAT
jgi:hypothetical protein